MIKRTKEGEKEQREEEEK